jgi:thiamine-phosphate pyrophosphorylase
MPETPLCRRLGSLTRGDSSIEPGFKIYLITDRKLAAVYGGLIAMTAAALAAAPPKTVAVQLREKDVDAGELVAMARELRTICDQYRARLIVNDRIDIAIAARADGVHLPANSFVVSDARSLIGPERLIGVSTHDSAEVVTASGSGADFVVYGPVFDPLSKQSHLAARGAEGFMSAYRTASIPVFALGGINSNRVRNLGIAIAAKAASQATCTAGIAVIGSIFGTPDPAAAMRDLVRALASW